MLGLFNPLMREMEEMHYLLTEPVIMDDSALQKLIGPIAKTPYAEGIRLILAAARPTAMAGGSAAVSWETSDSAGPLHPGQVSGDQYSTTASSG